VRAAFETDWRGRLTLLVADEVDDDGGGQDRDIVLPVDDVDAIGVAEGEKTLGDVGDSSALPYELIFEIEEIAGDRVVVGARDIDFELVLEQTQLLGDFGEQFSITMNVVGLHETEDLLRDECQFVALHVLE